MITFKEFLQEQSSRTPIEIKMILNDIVAKNAITNGVQMVVIAQMLNALEHSEINFEAFKYPLDIQTLKSVPEDELVDIAAQILQYIESQESQITMPTNLSTVAHINSTLQHQH